jgi:hypothetical protein
MKRRDELRGGESESSLSVQARRGEKEKGSEQRKTTEERKQRERKRKNRDVTGVTQDRIDGNFYSCYCCYFLLLLV